MCARRLAWKSTPPNARAGSNQPQKHRHSLERRLLMGTHRPAPQAWVCTHMPLHNSSLTSQPPLSSPKKNHSKDVTNAVAFKQHLMALQRQSATAMGLVVRMMNLPEDDPKFASGKTCPPRRMLMAWLASARTHYMSTVGLKGSKESAVCKFSTKGSCSALLTHSRSSMSSPPLKLSAFSLAALRARHFLMAPVAMLLLVA